MKKAWLSTFSVAILSLSILTGCGQNNAPPENNNAPLDQENNQIDQNDRNKQNAENSELDTNLEENGDFRENNMNEQTEE